MSKESRSHHEISPACLLDVGFGKMAVMCSEKDLSRPVVIASPYVTPPSVAWINAHERSSLDDQYAMLSVREGEKAVVPQGIDDHVSYLISMGIVPHHRNIIQVDQKRKGLGHIPEHLLSDSVWQALYQKMDLPPHAYYVCSFPHEEMSCLARERGLDPIQTFNHHDASDKYLFHQMAKVRDVLTSSYALIHTPHDLYKFYEKYAKKVDDIWAKARDSSGGEGVWKISGFSQMGYEEFVQAFYRQVHIPFRTMAQSTFDAARLSQYDFLQTWPLYDVSPEEGILLEPDASYREKEDITCKKGRSPSNILVIPKNGKAWEIARFTQLLSPSGDFIGSTLESEDPHPVSNGSDDDHITTWLRDDHRVTQVIGTDEIELITSNRTEYCKVEANVRPPVSAHMYMAFDALRKEVSRKNTTVSGTMTFAHAKLHTGKEILRMRDVFDHIGEEYACRSIDDLIRRGYGVIPLCVGGWTEDGVLVPEKEYRAMVVAPSSEICTSILDEIKNK